MSGHTPFHVIATLVVSSTLSVSCLLTFVVRRYVLRHFLLDIPNPRSSHILPTPRGGGIAIVVAWFVALVILMWLGRLDAWVGVALLGGGGAIALIGWLDDRHHLSAGIRAGVHLVAAAWAVWCLGGLPSLDVGPGVVPLGWLGGAVAVIGIAWLTNLYNFMDGIDGLAAGEAVSVGLVGGGLLAFAGTSGMALAAVSLAAAAGGFLVFNWPPAKIFMGDVGSGLLGYALKVKELIAVDYSDVRLEKLKDRKSVV